MNYIACALLLFAGITTENMYPGNFRSAQAQSAEAQIAQLRQLLKDNVRGWTNLYNRISTLLQDDQQLDAAILEMEYNSVIATKRALHEQLDAIDALDKKTKHVQHDTRYADIPKQYKKAFDLMRQVQLSETSLFGFLQQKKNKTVQRAADSTVETPQEKPVYTSRGTGGGAVTSLLIGVLVTGLAGAAFATYLLGATGAIGGYIATQFGATVPQAFGVAAVTTPAVWSGLIYRQQAKKGLSTKEAFKETFDLRFISYAAAIGLLGAYMILRK